MVIGKPESSRGFVPAKDVLAARLRPRHRRLVEVTAPYHADKNALVAVRNLRRQVGIPDHAQQLRRTDFDYLADLALAEGMLYPSPRLLSRPEVLAILGRIAT